MSKVHVKTGDTVIVISGKDKVRFLLSAQKKAKLLLRR